MWRLMGCCHDWLLGASYYNWLHQHLLGHHPFTSIEQLDPDVVTGNPDARRIKTNQPLLSVYRWQHVYMPFLYGVLAAKFRVFHLESFDASPLVQEFGNASRPGYLKKYVDTDHDNDGRIAYILEEWVHQVLTFSYRLVWPKFPL